MSGPAPPNPGAPKINPHAPRVPLLARHGSKLAAGGALAITAYMYLAFRPPQPGGTQETNPMRTPGVQNIEKAYTNAGATATHTKAYGGTKQGDKEGPAMADHRPSGTGAAANKTTPFEKEGMGDEQRPHGTTKAGEAFDHMNLGSSKGK